VCVCVCVCVCARVRVILPVSSKYFCFVNLLSVLAQAIKLAMCKDQFNEYKPSACFVVFYLRCGDLLECSI